MAAGAFTIVADAAQTLEASGLGQAMRGARGYYPAANLAHLLGLVMLVGGIGVLDLRIAGVGRRIPLEPLSRMLTPIAVLGLIVAVSSGFLLFAADAGPMVQSPVFRTKMLLAAAALANAFLFRRWFGDLRRGGEPPLTARLLAGLSIALWVTVGGLGRYIAYS